MMKIYRIDYKYHPYAKTHQKLTWKDTKFVHVEDEMEIPKIIDKMTSKAKNLEQIRCRESTAHEEIDWWLNQHCNIIGLPDNWDGAEIEIHDVDVEELIKLCKSID